jgi:5-methylcytosine-specific restriction enzyme subunit McrC
MKHLVVTECFGSIPITMVAQTEDCLTPEEADDLAAYIRNTTLDEDSILISRHEVIFINYVGFIQLRTCSIEILPKVTGDNQQHSRRVLLLMLQRSGFLDIHESEIGKLTSEKINLFEILAYLFINKLSHELRKGVYRNYRREQGDLQLVRGKIDMNRQLRRESTMQAGISCIYEEFQVNNSLNQIIKSALLVVMNRCRYSATKKRAAGMLSYMDEVVMPPGSTSLNERVHFDRTNRRFEPCYLYAKLLLGRSAPISSPGVNKSSSILFKMNDLFEAYIAYLARKLWKKVVLKDRSHKLLVKEGSTRGVFQLEPDLLITTKTGYGIIIDTKWKMIFSRLSRHGVKREDFFQMYAYLTRYETVRDVILLYPHHDGIDSSGVCLESWHLEGDAGKRLKVFSINYEDEQVAMKELDRIIESIH